MKLQNNKYIVTLLIFAHLLLVQTYHLFHVHTFEGDQPNDIIHNIHSVHHESHNNLKDDYHQHEHDELHFSPERFIVHTIVKNFGHTDVQQIPQAILTNCSINSELVLQYSIKSTTPISPTDWLNEPFQGRSPPIFG